MSQHLDSEAFAAFEEFRGEARNEALRHLRSCAECRAALASRDPSHLFALLALEPLPVEILDQVSAGVASGIGEERRPAPARSRWLAAGALAAALAIAVLLGFQFPRSPEQTELPPDPRIEPGTLAPHAQVEILSSQGSAQVLDLTIGDTQLVMIFDEELEL